MGLYDSELDISESDLSIPTTIYTDSFYAEKKRRQKKWKSEKEETDWPSSMPEDEEEEAVEDADEEANEDVDEVGDKDLPSDIDPDELMPKPVEKPSFRMSRAELRKMQEALTWREGDAEHPNQMDLRVGKIVHIQPLGDEVSYISEVDLGRYDDSRLIATGLEEHYKVDDLLDRLVLILCNVKPLISREIRSKTGMLLLATKGKFDDKGEEVGELVEVIEPYNIVEPGSRVYVEEFPMVNPFRKTDEEFFDFVVKDFTVNSELQVLWRGLPLKIENHPDNKLVVRSLNDTYCKLD